MALYPISIGIGYPELSCDEAYYTCLKNLICFHKCKKLKGHPEPCGTGNCPYLRRYKRRCGHDTNRPCMIGHEANLPLCSWACTVPKKCGHPCKALCSECDGICPTLECSDSHLRPGNPAFKSLKLNKAKQEKVYPEELPDSAETYMRTSSPQNPQYEYDSDPDEEPTVVGIDFSSPENAQILSTPLNTDKKLNESATNRQKANSQGIFLGLLAMSSPSPPNLESQDYSCEYDEVSYRSQRKMPPKLQSITSQRFPEEPTWASGRNKRPAQTASGNGSKPRVTSEPKKAAAKTATAPNRPGSRPEPPRSTLKHKPKQPDNSRPYWRSAPPQHQQQRPQATIPLRVRTSALLDEAQNNLDLKRLKLQSDVGVNPESCWATGNFMPWQLKVATQWFADRERQRALAEHELHLAEQQKMAGEAIAAAEIEAAASEARRIAARRKLWEEWMRDDSPPPLYSDEEDETPATSTNKDCSRKV